jgi:hypothetical protein
MVIGEDFPKAQTGIEDVRVFGSTGNAEASAGPDAEVPGLAVERPGGLGIRE